MWFFPVNRLLIYFSFSLALNFFLSRTMNYSSIIAPSFCVWNLNGKLKVLPLHLILAFNVIKYNNWSTLLFIRNRCWILCHFFSAFIRCLSDFLMQPINTTSYTNRFFNIQQYCWWWYNIPTCENIVACTSMLASFCFYKYH